MKVTAWFHPYLVWSKNQYPWDWVPPGTHVLSVHYPDEYMKGHHYMNRRVVATVSYVHMFTGPCKYVVTCGSHEQVMFSRLKDAKKYGELLAALS